MAEGKAPKKNVVALQIRIGEDLYSEAKKEAERLSIPLNSVLIMLIDEGVKYRELTRQALHSNKTPLLDCLQKNQKLLSQESIQPVS